jgi:O-antigen/teichoic acid export membrane protein
VTSAAIIGRFRAVLQTRGQLLLDQILFSAGNFGMSIFVARQYGYNELASLGVAFSAALVVQGFQRPLYVVPTALRSERRQARVFAGINGEHAIALGIILVITVVTLELLRRITTIHPDLYAATIASVLVFGQSDFDRYALVRSGRLAAPAAFSAAYAATLSIAAALSWLWSLSFVFFMGVVVAFALAKIICVMAMTARPNFRWGAKFLMRDVRVRGWYALTSIVSYSGFMHFPVFALSVLSGPAQTAGFIAMRNLVQPFPILMRSFDIRDKLAFRSTSLKSSSQLSKTFWRVASFYFLIGACAIVAIFFVSGLLVSLTYGRDYLPFETIMLGHVTVFTVLAILYPLESVINIAKLFRSQVFWSTVSGTIGATIALLACGRYGAWGAIAATLTGALILTAGTLYSSRHILFAREAS